VVGGALAVAAIWWDSVDDPEVAPALGDCRQLALAAGAPNLVLLARILAGVIRVMGGAREAYPSCIAAFAELAAIDYGWANAWGLLCVSVVGELVADQPMATTHALR
jgi:hypothetical protein